jgi:hypothetical protein
MQNLYCNECQYCSDDFEEDDVHAAADMLEEDNGEAIWDGEEYKFYCPLGHECVIEDS